MVKQRPLKSTFLDSPRKRLLVINVCFARSLKKHTFITNFVLSDNSIGTKKALVYYKEKKREEQRMTWFIMINNSIDLV